MTKLTIISGLAGSGKTTFCKSVEQAYTDSIYHDEWVEQQYKLPWVSAIIRFLFKIGKTPRLVDKSIMRGWLKEKPELNVILANYFKAKFVMYLSSILQGETGSIIVECPFLDDNIRALKKTYPDQVTIVWMKTSDEIINRLEARGWDATRVVLSVQMQERMYHANKDLVDGYV